MYIHTYEGEFLILFYPGRSPLTLARSGGLMQPPMSFSELDATLFGESC